MIYDKPFLSYPRQVALLRSRGLVIQDEQKAVRALKQNNYYRLSAYVIPFQSVKDRFDPGTTIEDILKLYEMDGTIRIQVFSWLEKLEIALRAFLGYHIAEKYGPFGYIDPGIFGSGFQYEKWMTGFRKEKSRSAETFIKHYAKKYSGSRDLPVWMATEIMSLGCLSTLLKGLHKKVQKTMAKKLDLPAPVFASWVHCLTYTRNLCAHHSRIWNRELAIKPVVPDDSVWSSLKGRNNHIYAVFKIINHFGTYFSLELTMNLFLSRIKSDFDCFPFKVLVKMGFPENTASLEG